MKQKAEGQKHKYEYQMRTDASVEFCACGRWRFTEDYLKKSPAITEVR